MTSKLSDEIQRMIEALRKQGLDVTSVSKRDWDIVLHNALAVDQAGWRWRADDGSEATGNATFLAAENTGININIGPGLDVDRRLRFLVEETNNGSGNNQSYTLQFSLNGGTWTNISNLTSDPVRYFDSIWVAAPASTTDHGITPTNATFIAANDGQSETAVAGAISYAGNDYTYLEYTVRFNQAQLAATDTVDFRLAEVDTATGGNATVTVIDNPGTVDQTSYRWRADDGGDETAAEWLAAVNTAISINIGNGQNSSRRLRFLFTETEGLDTAVLTGALQWRLNGGAWNNIGTSSLDPVRYWSVTGLVNGNDTTQQVGAGSFTTPNGGQIEDGNGGTAQLLANTETEYEFSVLFQQANLSSGDTVEFRLATADTFANLGTANILDIAYFMQDDACVRYDDGPEVAETSGGATEGTVTRSLNNRADSDTWALKRRLRFAISNVNTTVAAANQNYRLMFSKNGGTWTEVSTVNTALVYGAPSTYVANGDPTTDHMSNDLTPNVQASTFDSGGEVVTDGNSSSIDLPADSYIILEYVVNINLGQLNDGDTLGFRVYRGTVTPIALDEYETTLTMTANKPSGDTTTDEYYMLDYRWRLDDGDETNTGATFETASRAAYTLDLSAGDADRRLRFSFGVTNAATGGNTNTSGHYLSYTIIPFDDADAGNNVTGREWKRVTDTPEEPVWIFDSANVTNGNSTTNHGMSPLGSVTTFISPNDGIVDGDGAAGEIRYAANIALASAEFLNAEVSLRFEDPYFTDGDKILFAVGDPLSTTKAEHNSLSDWIEVTVSKPGIDLQTWRWRNDDGGEGAPGGAGGATFIAGENAIANLDLSAATDKKVRLRTAIGNTNAATATGWTGQMQYRINGGAWTSIGNSATAPVFYYDSTHITENADTTNHGVTATTSPGAFLTTNGGVDENGVLFSSGIDWGGDGQWTIAETTIGFRPGYLDHGDLVEFRVNEIGIYDNGYPATLIDFKGTRRLTGTASGVAYCDSANKDKPSPLNDAQTAYLRASDYGNTVSGNFTEAQTTAHTINTADENQWGFGYLTRARYVIKSANANAFGTLTTTWSWREAPSSRDWSGANNWYPIRAWWESDGSPASGEPRKVIRYNGESGSAPPPADLEDTVQKIGTGTFIANNDGTASRTASNPSASSNECGIANFTGNDETEYQIVIEASDFYGQTEALTRRKGATYHIRMDNVDSYGENGYWTVKFLPNDELIRGSADGMATYAGCSGDLIDAALSGNLDGTAAGTTTTDATLFNQKIAGTASGTTTEDGTLSAKQLIRGTTGNGVSGFTSTDTLNADSGWNVDFLWSSRKAGPDFYEFSWRSIDSLNHHRKISHVDGTVVVSSAQISGVNVNEEGRLPMDWDDDGNWVILQNSDSVPPEFYDETGTIRHTGTGTPNVGNAIYEGVLIQSKDGANTYLFGEIQPGGVNLYSNHYTSSTGVVTAPENNQLYPGGHLDFYAGTDDPRLQSGCMTGDGSAVVVSVFHLTNRWSHAVAFDSTDITTKLWEYRAPQDVAGTPMDIMEWMIPCYATGGLWWAGVSGDDLFLIHLDSLGNATVIYQDDNFEDGFKQHTKWNGDSNYSIRPFHLGDWGVTVDQRTGNLLIAIGAEHGGTLDTAFDIVVVSPDGRFLGNTSTLAFTGDALPTDAPYSGALIHSHEATGQILWGVHNQNTSNELYLLTLDYSEGASVTGTLQDANAGPSSIDGTAAGTTTTDATLFNQKIAGTASGTSPEPGGTSGALFGLGLIDGTAAGTTTEDGTLFGLGELVGSADGTTTEDGTLFGLGFIDGTAAGTTTEDGTLFGLGFIDGTAAGTTTENADLRADAFISGTAAGTTTEDAQLLNEALIGTAAGTTTENADLRADAFISGTINGTTTEDGTLRADGFIDGTAAGTTTENADLRADAFISGTINGTTTEDGTLFGLGELFGSADGTTTEDGTLYGIGHIDGTAAGTTTEDGTLRADAFISGTINGTTTEDGTLRADAFISGTINGTTTEDGTLRADAFISGTINGTTTEDGTLFGLGELFGSADGTTTEDGTLFGTGFVDGTAAGTTTENADLRADAFISGTAAGTTTEDGTLSGGTTISGTINGTTTEDGTLRADAFISGTAAGTTTEDGTLYAIGHIDGTAAGTTTEDGTLFGTGELIGSADGTTTEDGTLTDVGVSSISGTINGTTTEDGTLRADAFINGTINGTTTEDGTLTDSNAAGNLVGTAYGKMESCRLWNPEDLGDKLWAWWDTDDQSTITLDGSEVIQIDDKLGTQNRQLVEAANGPTQTTFNGKSAIAQGDSATVALVLDGGAPPVDEMFSVIQTDDSQWMMASDNGSEWFGIADDGVTATTPDSGVGSPTYWVDGEEVPSPTRDDWHDAAFGTHLIAARNLDLSDWTSLFRLFHSGSATQYGLVGKYGETILIDGDLTLEERQKLEGFMSHGWGLDHKLNIAHPYFNEPPKIYCSTLVQVLPPANIAGTAAGSTVEDGTLTGDGFIDGTTNGTVIEFANLRDASTVLEGTAFGTTSESVDLSARGYLQGTIAAAAAFFVVITAGYLIKGTAEGYAEVSGQVATFEISGTAEGTATGAGTLRATASLVGEASGTSAPYGYLLGTDEVIANLAQSLSFAGSNIIPRRGSYILSNTGTVLDTSYDDLFSPSYNVGLWTERPGAIDASFVSGNSNEVMRAVINPVDGIADAEIWLDSDVSTSAYTSVESGVLFTGSIASQIKPLRIEATNGTEQILVELVHEPSVAVRDHVDVTYRDSSMGTPVTESVEVNAVNRMGVRITVANGKLQVWDSGKAQVLFATNYILDWALSWDLGAWAPQGGSAYTAYWKGFRHVPVVTGVPDYREGGLSFVSDWEQGRVQVFTHSGYPGKFFSEIHGTGTANGLSVKGGLVDCRDFETEEEQYQLMASNVEKLYDDAGGVLACRRFAVPSEDNRKDVTVPMFCYNDGSALDATAVDIVGRRTGGLQSLDGYPEVFIRDENGVEWGESFRFDKVLYSKSGALEAPAGHHWETTRTLSLRNGDRLYYGLVSPDDPVTEFHIFIDALTPTIYGTVGIDSSPTDDWQVFEVLHDGTEVLVASGAMDGDILLGNLPRGDYRVRRSNGGLFQCDITIEKFVKLWSYYLTYASSKVTSFLTATSTGVTEFDFSVYSTASRIGALYHDVSENTVTPYFSNFVYASARTKSLAAVETPEGEIAFFYSRGSPAEYTILDNSIEYQMFEPGVGFDTITHRLHMPKDVENDTLHISPSAEYWVHGFDMVRTGDNEYTVVFTARLPQENLSVISTDGTGSATVTPRVQPIYSDGFFAVEISEPTFGADIYADEAPVSAVTNKSYENLFLYRDPDGVAGAKRWARAELKTIKAEYDEDKNLVVVAGLDRKHGWPMITAGIGSFWAEVGCPYVFDAPQYVYNDELAADIVSIGYLGLDSLHAAFGQDGFIYCVATKRNEVDCGVQLAVLDPKMFYEDRDVFIEKGEKFTSTATHNLKSFQFDPYEGGLTQKVVDILGKHNVVGEGPTTATLSKIDQHLLIGYAGETFTHPVYFQNSEYDQYPFQSSEEDVFLPEDDNSQWLKLGGTDNGTFFTLNESQFVANTVSKIFGDVKVKTELDYATGGDRGFKFHGKLQVGNGANAANLSAFPASGGNSNMTARLAWDKEGTVYKAFARFRFSNDDLLCEVSQNGTNWATVKTFTSYLTSPEIVDYFIVGRFADNDNGVPEATFKFVYKRRDEHVTKDDTGFYEDYRNPASWFSTKITGIVDAAATTGFSVSGSTNFSLLGGGDDKVNIFQLGWNILPYDTGWMLDDPKNGLFEAVPMENDPWRDLTDGHIFELDDGAFPHVGFRVLSLNNTDPVTGRFHWPNGFKYQFSGQAIAVQDSWELSRQIIWDTSYLMSNRLHGIWYTQFDGQTSYIWADAADSNMDKFLVNCFMVKGSNTRKITLVGKNNIGDSWTEISELDLKQYNLTDVNQQVADGVDIMNAKRGAFLEGTFGKGFDFYYDVAGTDNAKVLEANGDEVFLNTDSVRAETEGVIFGTDGVEILDEDVSYRYVGIKLEDAETHEGYYLLHTFDFGYAGDVFEDFRHTFGGGLKVQSMASIQVAKPEQAVPTKSIREKAEFEFQYSFVDARAFANALSIVEKVVHQNKPVWVLQDGGYDSGECWLCLISGDVQHDVIIDEDGEKYYTLNISLRSVS